MPTCTSLAPKQTQDSQPRNSTYMYCLMHSLCIDSLPSTHPGNTVTMVSAPPQSLPALQYKHAGSDKPAECCFRFESSYRCSCAYKLKAVLSNIGWNSSLISLKQKASINSDISEISICVCKPPSPILNACPHAAWTGCFLLLPPKYSEQQVDAACHTRLPSLMVTKIRNVRHYL